MTPRLRKGQTARKPASRPVDPRGLVYTWTLEDGGVARARAIRSIVRLRNLATDPCGQVVALSGRFVVVHNAGLLNQPDPATGQAVATPLGDAVPNQEGHFLFDPGRGGGRVDRVSIADDGFRGRYVQAARFGEVNVYHHVDRIAEYIAGLLQELGARELPRVTAIVNAHHGAVVDAGSDDGSRDGVHRIDGRWVPFQGGHYRLPGPATIIPERFPISPNGEIHLGPGQQLTRQGALARSVGGAYRANASHNPGIIYHEYGHHITSHTADFRANDLRRRDRQSNKKTAIDEGTADYWAAALLGTPHIWFFHHPHDGVTVHPRSLTSDATMRSFARGPGADVHANGTIWAAALWEIRSRVVAVVPEGAAAADRLVLQALLLMGELAEKPIRESLEPSPVTVGRLRRSFRGAARALLEADRILYHGRLRDVITTALGRREIDPEISRGQSTNRGVAVPS